MEWLNHITDSINLSNLVPHLLLVAIVVVICAFGLSAFKAHYKHVERLEKIKQGLDPDC